MIYGTFVEACGRFGRQIHFLSRALGHDKTLPVHHHITVEPSEKEDGKFTAFASDGRRLHVVDPLDCPDGIGVEPGEWRFLRSKPEKEKAWIAKINTGCDNPIPLNYRKVIPSGKPVFETGYRPVVTEGRLLKERLGDFVKFIIGFPEPTIIDPDYFAFLDMRVEFWEVSWYGKHKAVVFESGCLKAVIMPKFFND